MILLALAVIAELAFWMCGIESQFSEVWLVLVAVPVGLHFSAPKPLKTSPKCKVFEEEANDTKKKTGPPSFSSSVAADKRRAAKKVATEKAGSAGPTVAGPFDLERTALKADFDMFVKSGDTSGAEGALKKLSGVGAASAVCYNMMISLCSKQHQTKEAQEWMRRMLESGVKPDVASFNSTIDACARAGDTARAEYWLQRMTAIEVLPNTITCNTVINAWARVGDMEGAERWMGKFIHRS